jgi:hypothetical protein
MNAKSTKGTKPKAVAKPIKSMSRLLLADVRQMILQAREGWVKIHGSGRGTYYTLDYGPGIFETK